MTPAGQVGGDCQGKREEPITGTAIPLAKTDMQVKHNYKTPGIIVGPPLRSEWLNDDEEHDANHR
jgi:hypothetical protein